MDLMLAALAYRFFRQNRQQTQPLSPGEAAAAMLASLLPALPQDSLPPSPSLPVERTTDMPQTPVALICSSNCLFGSIDISYRRNIANAHFPKDQLPSTYYMNNLGNFLRLRTLHDDGFAMYEDAGRVVGIYTGAWDHNDDYQTNAASGNCIFRNLGNTANGIRLAIQGLITGPAMSTAQLIAHNSAQMPPQINQQIVYINDGAMTGTVWGGSAAITNNLYHPMDIVDADAVDEEAHTGHSFVLASVVEQFYNKNYPGVLNQLMRLGYSSQSLAVAIGANGLLITEQIATDRKYFPISQFGDDRQRQLEFMVKFINSFV